ncbi:hypothetical protein D3C74_445400 [compost metagenome]
MKLIVHVDAGFRHDPVRNPEMDGKLIRCAGMDYEIILFIIRQILVKRCNLIQFLLSCSIRRVQHASTHMILSLMNPDVLSVDLCCQLRMEILAYKDILMILIINSSV